MQTPQSLQIPAIGLTLLRALRLSMVLVAVLGSAAVLLGCSEKAKDVRTSLKDSNVVFIVVDTLRADHLPLYGYPKDTAPFVTSLRSHSVIFDRAISACSSTGPAMASVFTSLYPSQHGLITGILATQRLVKSNPENPTIKISRIPVPLKTLGQYFKEAGYRTFGVADNLNISEQQGFTKGFDKFATYRYEGAPTVNRTLREWSSEIKAAGRYFLYVHYMDPHAPYHRRKPWFVKGASRAESTLNAYDSEIRYADEHISELFEMFNLDRNTLVVFLSDHGEEFGDHGGSGHGKTLYREVIHVPLFFYHPSFTETRVTEVVHTIDVLPTLASVLGLATDAHWVGKSLEGFIPGSAQQRFAADSRPVFSQLLRRPEHEKDPKESVIHERHHLIVTPKRDGRIVEELYQLDEDFVEQVDLAAARRDIVQGLAGKFRELHEKKPGIQAEEVDLPLDADAIRSLKTLGYLE